MLSKDEFIHYMIGKGYVIQDTNAIHCYGVDMIIEGHLPSDTHEGLIRLGRSKDKGVPLYEFRCEVWPESMKELNDLYQGVVKLISQEAYLILRPEEDQYLDVTDLLGIKDRVLT